GNVASESERQRKDWGQSASRGVQAESWSDGQKNGSTLPGEACLDNGQMEFGAREWLITCQT
ncbi:hypothetical protein P7K49_039399, partial [Saguinus oedipus]